MCNAWNHPPDCDCAFSGGYRGNYSSASQVSTGQQETRQTSHNRIGAQFLHPAHGLQLDNQWYRCNTNWPPSEPLTYPTTCWHCGEEIFVHSNGYGDTVLLEPPLGAPWSKHNCLSISKLPDRYISNKVSWVHSSARVALKNANPVYSLSSLHLRDRLLVAIVCQIEPELILMIGRKLFRIEVDNISINVYIGQIVSFKIMINKQGYFVGRIFEFVYHNGSILKRRLAE